MFGFGDASRPQDALARLPWEQLEAMLAVHYRGRGHRVEHCGTGAGIVLKLRRDGDAALRLVCCPQWNARPVPAEAVRDLRILMEREGANGGVLVACGAFSPAAVAAAAGDGRVELVDGEALRRMLGPVPDALLALPPAARRSPMDWDWPVRGHGMAPAPADAAGDAMWLAKLAGAALVFAGMLLAYRAVVSPPDDVAPVAHARPPRPGSPPAAPATASLPAAAALGVNAAPADAGLQRAQAPGRAINASAPEM
ncbi:MAG TPA: restriction endonuclease [Thermomonas sp.]|nr:restriction endonuclease [Thermomonas sp.]